MKNQLNSRLLPYVFLFFSVTVFSQVGIGTTTPRASLEISNTESGGILIPRYALAGSNDITTVVNPQGGALEVGTLVFNTTQVAGVNGIEEGFVFWDGSQWQCIAPKNQIMQRSFTFNNLSADPTIPFNFDNELFNNIEGSSFSGTTLTLPRGVYELNATIRVNERLSIDYRTRVDGNGTGTVGTSSSASFNSNAGSYSPVNAVFEITAAFGSIDFVVTNAFEQGSGNVSNGLTVLPGQCYMTIKKL